MLERHICEDTSRMGSKACDDVCGKKRREEVKEIHGDGMKR